MADKSDILVVDTGGFIENLRLDDFAEKIYTVSAVVKEIRDSKTRRRLQVLPYEIQFQEPSPASMSEVRKVASETGDLRSLSITDIKVLALTHELHNQAPASSVDEEEEEMDEEEEEEKEQETKEEEEKEQEMKEQETKEEEEKEQETKEEEEDEQMDEEEEGKDDEEEEDEEDDEEGWVTADNLNSVDFHRQFAAAFPDEAPVETPRVACLTTDFAMQNVLLRMGLGLRSVNGRAVRSVKSFVLWCYSCYKHTLDQSKYFCPKCGNRTLRKVSASVDGDGKLELHFAKKFQLRKKGLNRQTDAKFTGGKYSFNKIYSEDQPMPHQRPSKKAMQRDAMEAVSSDCPFALRDLSSRAARIGMNKRNRTRVRK